MSDGQNDITGSLSASNRDIEKHIDYLLQDLDALGSSTQKVIDIMEENRSILPKNISVLELCCGKGALLQELAAVFNIKGTGIDLHPPFIDIAKKQSRKRGFQDRLTFKVMDIQEAVTTFRDFDLLVAGYDTDVLGSEVETLKKISSCVKPEGMIIYETANESYDTILESIKESNLTVIATNLYSRAEKIKINTFNTEKIKNRAHELIQKYPAEADLFKQYIRDQEEESEDLNNNLCWGIFLLSK